MGTPGRLRRIIVGEKGRWVPWRRVRPLASARPQAYLSILASLGPQRRGRRASFFFMETAAAVRKARIVALRELKQAEEAGDEAAISANVFGQRVKRHFRSSMPPAALLPQGDEAAVSTVENDVRDMQESVMAEDTRKQAEELDLANIAPRRPNWDLRRDLDARLALLEPRTEEAIHTLIVRRLGASRDRQEDVANVLANE